ncbi:MAG TPA: hypothetical protein VEY51_03455 [Chondromyces sp.]|nr:hypothetical protein [Chondromyces sp.]
MNILLDAKLIDTQYGLEAYLDRTNTVEITSVHTPGTHSSLCEIKLGINYFLLRDRNFGNRKNYLSIRLNNYNGLVTLIEPKTENIFAVKNEVEREATKNLIAEWLIKTDAFNYAVTQQIQKLKKNPNIQTEDDIKKLTNAIKFLEKLLQLKTKDIQNAPIQQEEYTAVV